MGKQFDYNTHLDIKFGHFQKTDATQMVPTNRRTIEVE